MSKYCHSKASEVTLYTTGFEVLVSAVGQSVANKHDSEVERVTVDLHHETEPSRSLPAH